MHPLTVSLSEQWSGQPRRRAGYRAYISTTLGSLFNRRYAYGNIQMEDPCNGVLHLGFFDEPLEATRDLSFRLRKDRSLVVLFPVSLFPEQYPLGHWPGFYEIENGNVLVTCRRSITTKEAEYDRTAWGYWDRPRTRGHLPDVRRGV